MSRKTNLFAILIAILLTISHLGWPPDSSAELLAPDALQDCELHVVGIYSPKDHSQDDRVYVQVKATEKPMVLVLTGYFGAQWNVSIDPDADVRQILIPGYFEHDLVGVSESIPTEFITYFPKADASRKDYFWSYSWNTARGRELRSRLKELTGLEIKTFQGEYYGTRFVVDGKLGDVDGVDLPRVDPARAAKSKTSIGERQLKAAARNARLKHQSLLATYGENHPTVKTILKQLDLIEAELDRIGLIADAGDTDATNSGGDDLEIQDEQKIIETLVRQSFELETQLQSARVAKAEADLARIKKQLAEREQYSEQIIAKRIDELTVQTKPQSETATNPPRDVPASVLSSEGWSAWQKQDWRTAHERFEAALAKDAQFEAAQNGMGWTLVHLREYDKAIKQFRALLAKNPTHPGALNGVGQCLLAQDKLDEAETEFLQATNSAIDSMGEETVVRRGITASWMGLVQTYLRSGDAESAQKWIDRYLKHKPDDPMMKQMKAQADEISTEKK